MHTITQKADAYMSGYESGYFLGGKYFNAYNPYTTYWPGVVLNAWWRDGFKDGVLQKREDADGFSEV